MKIAPVTKLVKRNTSTSITFDNEVMPEDCDVIVIFRIYNQFGAIQKPDSERMICIALVFHLYKSFILKKFKTELTKL